MLKRVESKETVNYFLSKINYALLSTNATHAKTFTTALVLSKEWNRRLTVKKHHGFWAIGNEDGDIFITDRKDC
jgi:hypothetical protein